MILPIDRKTTLPFLEKCLSFIKASSLALEPWTGTCFVLAALMPPKQKKKVPPEQHFLCRLDDEGRAVDGLGRREQGLIQLVGSLLIHLGKNMSVGI